jgi:type III pantothenate kinase
MTFLAIDIGNTRLKWAQYSAPHPKAELLAHGAVFLEAIDGLADGDWKDLEPPDSVFGCVVAGEAIKRRCIEQLEMWDVEPGWAVSTAQACGVVNGYEHPHRLGVDRWASAIGARHRVLREGEPRSAMVVMVGTAVTIDSIDVDGRFLGGLILPGFGLMQKALESGTSGLRVPTGTVVDFPTNTSDALMTGGTQAIAGAIERTHRRLKARTGDEPALFITGGATPKIMPILDLPFLTVDTLIFEGLLQMQSHRLAL